ncbi:MAG: biopolymer transporter ExbD [Gammaproteobacteria bacterium]|nr:biopolymer transporter ExbD [Gammaproteobacteria bacterium]NNJ84821.1 biopolymer transporter ExbD [Gammaproteobacteria bacterium]
MKLPQTEKKPPYEPIGPLVDIVFLLLVFFLLVGTLAPVQPLAVAPPTAENTEIPTQGPLLVLLDTDGRLAFDGRILDSDALAEALEPVVAAREQINGKQTVHIEADAEVPAKRVLDLLKRLRAVGVEEFRLLTRVIDR